MIFLFIADICVAYGWQESQELSLPASSRTIQDTLQSGNSPLQSAGMQDPVGKHIDYRVAYKKIIQDHPYFQTDAPALNLIVQERSVNDKDARFYTICVLLLLAGLIRQGFPKYFHDLMWLFFRASSFRQKQIREQLLQTPLPSLLMNIFFVFAAGVYIGFLLQYYGSFDDARYWPSIFSCVLLVMALYLGKFLVLRLVGWLFNISETMETYIFIVFLINKIIGLTLIPILIFLFFGQSGFLPFLLNLSYLIVGFLFVYRFVLSYRAIIRDVKVSRLHFFLYLCAFEIAPILVIWKLLLRFL